MREMPGLYLHTSNRLETLLEDLAAVVGKPLPVILQPETIVVQSLGMGRWLSLQLAKQQGICAHVQFPVPWRFLSDVFRVALPETPEGKHFDPKIMTWRLMHVCRRWWRGRRSRRCAIMLMGSGRDLNAFNSPQRSPTRSASTSLSGRK